MPDEQAEEIDAAAPRRPDAGPRGGHRFFVTAARGTEGPLRREIAALRIAGARGDTGGVWFEGPLEMGFAVCLHARVAMRVLVQVGEFQADSADALYAGVRALDWSPWLTARTTLAVNADVSDQPNLHHTGFAALKVKDAIVDALRDKLGTRPNVNPRDPDVSVRLHMRGTEARVFLDLAGEPLHRRGYRVAMTDAPLKENLAAAVLALGRVELDRPFVDPMAGSGTLAIEQALAARRIAPGLKRRFGFERWPSFAGEAPRRAWDRLREQARADELPAAPEPIVCADRFTAAVEAAQQNAAAAGVANDLTFEVAEARDAAPRWPHGNLVMNPPYGERLMGAPEPQRPAQPTQQGKDRSWTNKFSQPAPAPASKAFMNSPAGQEHVQGLKLAGLYRGLGQMFERFAGWGVVVLSGSPVWAHEVRRKAIISHRLFNGPLEVRLLRYDL